MNRMLITAFRPFRGRERNGSATVLRWMRRRWPAGFAASRILEVHWEKAPRQVAGLIKRHRPKYIFGLGEGQPDRVAVEMRAQNRMLGPDEAGMDGGGLEIAPGGPEEMRSRVDFDLRLFAGASWRTVLSEDAGCFLCNRVLWEMLCHRPLHSGFIHLPPQGETPDAEYVRSLGPPLLALLRQFAQ